jgi:hypothetical protein
MIPKKGLERFTDYKDKIKIGYLMIDRFDIKSISMIVKGHMTVTEEKKIRTIQMLNYRIRQYLSQDINQTVYRRQFITSEVYPDSIEETGKAFVNFEFTFFPKIKDKNIILSEMQLMMDGIFENVIEKFEGIEFNKSSPRSRKLCQSVENETEKKLTTKELKREMKKDYLSILP